MRASSLRFSGTIADMVERWTRARRLEHTRTLLPNAAEEVIAEKGFTPATLDDIAHTAGYTKGAIYKHFTAKGRPFPGGERPVLASLLR